MRRKAWKIERRGHCRVYWGSHGCRKQRGHQGLCRCHTGCQLPDENTVFYGEDTPQLKGRQLLTFDGGVIKPGNGVPLPPAYVDGETRE